MSGLHSQINLVSNDSVFHDAQAFLALSRGRDVPPLVRSSLIHEATHHWCFTSPVGSTLSLLSLSASRSTLQWALDGDDSDLDRVLDDLLTYRVLVEWLRPLSEGMALFAEFDVRLDPTARTPSPPVDAGLLYLFGLPRRLSGSEESPTRVRWHLTDDVNRWRLSPHVVSRKAELLLQPLEGATGHYLLGYLAVKRLWRRAAKQVPELADADLFMTYLRKLVYADYGLVARILDRSRPGPSRALVVAEYVFDRLSHLADLGDAAVDWDAFHEALTRVDNADPITNPDRADGLPYVLRGDDVDDVRRGIRLRWELVQEVLKPLDLPPEFRPLLADFFPSMLRERHLMWLCATPGRWVRLGDKMGRVEVDGEVVYESLTLTNASDESLQDVQLDVYLDLYARRTFTTISTDRDDADRRVRDVFGVISLEQREEGYFEELLRTRLDRDQIRRVTNMFSTQLPHYLDSTNFNDVLTGLWDRGVRDLLDETYRSLAFDDTRVSGRLEGSGLAQLLGGSADLVRGVAAVTLGASAGLSPDVVAGLCAGQPLSIADTLALVARRWPWPDQPLAAIDPHGFLQSHF